MASDLSSDGSVTFPPPASPGGPATRSVILAGLAGAQVAGRIHRVLEFFGVAGLICETAAWLGDLRSGAGNATGVALFCPAAAFLEMRQALEAEPALAHAFERHVHSVFIHAGGDAVALRDVITLLAGPQSTLRRAAVNEFAVTDRWVEFCGALSGLTCPLAAPAAGDYDAVALPPGGAGAETIKAPGVLISAPHGPVFLHFTATPRPVFLATTPEIIDLDQPLAGDQFDLQDHFPAAVPLVLYAKWAFGERAWHAPEANACLMIDDPCLTPIYGYLNYEWFLGLMERHRFATNIAFIPRHWKRSHPAVTNLFLEHPEKFSLAIHGCDHQPGEFGRPDPLWLTRRARQAVERMRGHAAKTGVKCDRVMVFPEGKFADAAPGILAQNGFLAIVNHKLKTTDPSPRAISVGSSWAAATMDYQSFPIYTRHQPAAGAANFAWDIVLGKPCLMWIRHDFCRDAGAALTRLIDRLNALPVRLQWRSLGPVIRRGFRERSLGAGLVGVEMYATEMHLKNETTGPLRYEVTRRADNPDLLQGVKVDGKAPSWTFADGQIVFAVELKPGQPALVQIEYKNTPKLARETGGFGYRASTTLRLFLLSLRDNYLMKLRHLLLPPKQN